MAKLIARGEAEIGMQQIVAILPVRGAELVGPLPAELQNVIIYAAGLSSRAPDAEAATAFMAARRAGKTAYARQWLRSGITTAGLNPP